MYEKKIKKRRYNYTGEMDLQGRACGFGEARDCEFPDLVYHGTFLNDEKHGLGEYIQVI